MQKALGSNPSGSILLGRELQLLFALIVNDYYQRTAWPSGLRRQLKALVRKGVGSNPTAVIFRAVKRRRHTRTCRFQRKICEGANGVAAAYKPPMLVTRVRFPVGALFRCIKLYFLAVTQRRRNRTPGCFHPPWFEATSEPQPSSPLLLVFCCFCWASSPACRSIGLVVMTTA